jgi:hypothetical protein
VEYQHKTVTMAFQRGTGTPQTQYQEYIAAVVSRYSNSTTIFVWELASELHCIFCFTSVITNWAKTTFAYIKSLGPNYMVAIGDLSFRSERELGHHISIQLLPGTKLRCKPGHLDY